MPDATELDIDLLPVVYIEWRDHSVVQPNSGAWEYLSSLLERAYVYEFSTIGFVIENNDSHLLVASTLSKDGVCSGVDVILKECITKMESIREGGIKEVENAD